MTFLSSFVSELVTYIDAALNDYTARQKYPAENHFKHPPLPDASSVRVLRIVSRQQNEITGSMRVVSLEDAPAYTALSYTWRKQYSRWHMVFDFCKSIFRKGPDYLLMREAEAEARPTRMIWCDGQQYWISNNLHDALLVFQATRSPDEEYWIDAVCINQSDLIEKTAQVNMMGRVYQSAQQVLIWLGSCSQERSLGIDGLEALAKIPPNQRPLCPLAEYMLSPDDAYQEKLAGVPFTLVAETAMHLVNRQSFKRTWVLQEFFLAQQVIFSYGDRYISMNAILAAFDWTFGTVNSSTGRNGNHIVSKKRLALLWAPHAKRMQTILLARSGFTSGHRLTLREWLWASQGRLAEDGRDFIFGGLSLIDPGSLKIKKTILQNTIFDPKDQDSLPTSSSHIPRGLWSVLAADYTASEQEVLVNLMACLFSSANPYPLDVLSLAARPPYRPSSRERSGIEPPPGDYPSCNSPRLNLCKTLSVNKQGISSLFHAAGAAGGDGQTFAAGLIQPSPSPQISCDGRMLFLDVALIDRICHIVDLEIFVNQSEVGKLSVFLEFLARLPRFYQGGLQTSFDAVATTLTSTLSSTTPLFPTSPGIPKDFNVRSGSFISVLDSPAPECLCEILEREIRIWIHTLREHTEVPDQGAKSARDKKEVESHLESM